MLSICQWYWQERNCASHNHTWNSVISLKMLLAHQWILEDAPTLGSQIIGADHHNGWTHWENRTPIHKVTAAGSTARWCDLGHAALSSTQESWAMEQLTSPASLTNTGEWCERGMASLLLKVTYKGKGYTVRELLNSNRYTVAKIRHTNFTMKIFLFI